MKKSTKRISKKLRMNETRARSAMNHLVRGAIAPFKASYQIVADDGVANKVKNSTSTILKGAGHLVSGFVDLSMIVANSLTSGGKSKSKKQTRSNKIKKAKEKINRKYSSLQKPIVVEDPRDSDEPREYWSHLGPDGIIFPHRIIDCNEAHCEGSGQFIFTHRQWEKYQSYGQHYPKKCDPCKFWVYDEKIKGDRNESCEKCGRLKFVFYKDQIAYHKFYGNPLISRLCNCSKVDPTKQLYRNYQGNVDSFVEGIKQYTPRKTRKQSKKQNGKNKGKALVSARMNPGKPFTKELIEHFDFYEKMRTNGGKITQYDHLWKHINQSETGGDYSMAEYGNPENVITRAHQIAHVYDPSRYREYTEDDGRTHIKRDLETNEVFVYNISGDKAYLRTAYKAIPESSDFKDLKSPPPKRVSQLYSSEHYIENHFRRTT